MLGRRFRVTASGDAGSLTSDEETDLTFARNFAPCRLPDPTAARYSLPQTCGQCTEEGALGADIKAAGWNTLGGGLDLRRAKL